MVVLAAVALVSVLGVTPAAAANPGSYPPGTMDPTTIPKWDNQITGPPPVFVPTAITDGAGDVVRYDYSVTMETHDQQILPPEYPETPVWAYGGQAQDAVTGEDLGFVVNSPGPTFEATRGIPSQVMWENDITTASMFCIDPTIHWANPNGMAEPTEPFTACPPGYAEAQGPVPLVPHLHGAEVQSTSDGGPDAWFTATGIHGPGYSTRAGAGDNQAIYAYPNTQQPTTLWYHDHALGITRITVMSGLAGFYLLRDPADPAAAVLPSGMYEQPLVLQDRIFNEDGSLWFSSGGVNPDIHPYWQPEFFGNTVIVNGLVWPNMDVTAGWYRFRFLDGSNARFYTLRFVDTASQTTLPFWALASDGGYLIAPQRMTDFTMAPGERLDVLVDFSSLARGSTVRLLNTAKAPFPAGTPADPRTVGQVLQFTVESTVHGQGGFATGTDLIAALPTPLNPTLVGSFPTLTAPTASNARVHTLYEVEGPEGPLMVTLDGQKWSAPVSETPTQGTTEMWVVFDATGDSHPIHLHLTQFQVVSRQSFNVKKYLADWIAANGGTEPPFTSPTVNVPAYTAYLQGMPKGPAPDELGWKDTVRMNPGEVTIFLVRYTAQDGTPYVFDPSVGPGYVWHCHILDHEDNEMMRPLEVVKA